MVVYESFEDAEAALQPGLVVAGAYRPVLDARGEEIKGVIGDPVYFHAPSDADRFAMCLMSFEARTGKPHPDPQYLGWLAAEVTE